MEEHKNDHDTLVRVETKLDQVICDMREMKDGTSIRIASNERCVRDAEKRIEALEKWKEGQKIYLQLIIFLGVLISGLVIYHITGVRVP